MSWLQWGGLVLAVVVLWPLGVYAFVRVFWSPKSYKQVAGDNSTQIQVNNHDHGW